MGARPPPRSIGGETPLKNTKTHFAANVEMWWGSLPFPDRIRAASAVGFKAFEFWPWRGKDLDSIAAAMKETGMICTQFTGWGFTPGMNDAGATSWLQTSAPVKGGDNVTVRFTIWDTGDHNLDSSVLIDAFQWIANGGKVKVGTIIPPA